MAGRKLGLGGSDESSAQRYVCVVCIRERGAGGKGQRKRRKTGWPREKRQIATCPGAAKK